MLRKSVHIVMALFLLTVSTGITFSMHYCGDHLVSAAVYGESSPCCGGTASCCHDVTLRIKIENKYLNSGDLRSPDLVSTDILFSLPDTFVLFFLDQKHPERIISDRSSPPTVKTRLSLIQTYLC